MSKETSDPTKYKMPEELWLGPDKDGNVFVEDWKREMGIYASGFYGDIAEALVDLKQKTWMDKNASFKWMVTVDNGDGTVRIEEAPFPDEKHADYRRACRVRDKWEDKQSRYEEKAPQLIAFLLNGTMVKSSRKRLMRVISLNNSPILGEIRENNDILLLVKHMVGIHDYKQGPADR